jgi:hypothetical protein
MKAMTDPSEALKLAERLAEYRKLKWSAPMKEKFEGRYQAVPLTFLDDAIGALTTQASEIERLRGERDEWKVFAEKMEPMLLETSREADAAEATVASQAVRIAEDKELLGQAWGALNFILAFYEPGQTYLDTNAWKQAEACGRAAHKALRERLERTTLAAQQDQKGEGG